MIKQTIIISSLLVSSLIAGDVNQSKKTPLLPSVDEQLDIDNLIGQCSKNDARACSNLGYFYAHGKNGVEKDLEKATELFRKSCNAGYNYGCVNLGLVYYETNKPENYKEQKELFEKTCEFEAFSCLGLGAIYYNGKGVEKNKTKAEEYYKKACDMGLDRGCEVYKKTIEKEK